MRKLIINEARVVEDIWLNYFNRYLFAHGTISEKEYKRMTERIATRVAGGDNKNSQKTNALLKKDEIDTSFSK